MGTHQALIERLKDRTAKIGIIGLGYVGLPLAIRYAEAGYDVLGLDVDSKKTDALNNGQSYIEHIPSSQLENLIGKIEATTDYSKAAEADAWIICVPTPLNRFREPDLSFVRKTVEALAPYLSSEIVVSLESTTFPGTTNEVVLPRLQTERLKVGRDFFLVYSPEREDPGNANFTTKTIPKVCGGVTGNCLEVGMALYEGVIDKVVPMSSTKAAEMTKLLENIYRAVNIGLVNEMKTVCDKMDIDIHEVIRAAATKPFGFTPYFPGPGLGGHCIPIDPFYLTWKAREYGVHTRFIELAGEVNSQMPQWVTNKVTDALNSRGKSVKGSRVLILGVAYKKNVADMRETPAAEVMTQLAAKGAQVSYSDPHVPEFPPMRNYKFDLNSVPLSDQTLKDFDCVVLITNHDQFDYKLIKDHSSLLVDTRGVFEGSSENLIKA